MKKYHFNPETGEPGECKATKACPFGLPLDEHLNSLKAARQAYEETQATFEKLQPTVQRVPHALPLDPDTIDLLESMTAVGMKPLIVGGTVRDSLTVNAIPKDVDIEVYGVSSMDELAMKLKKAGYPIKEVGKAFGVLKTVLPSGLDIDVSLPRQDNHVGEGHRGFEVEINTNLSLEEAAARRDFTINALYYDYETSEILDAHGGLADWKAGQLRHVSEAYAEDPLRVLRAMQFSSRFDLEIHPETAEESRRIKDQYSTISTERIQEEWTKLFTKAKSVRAGLHTLRATGWDEHFGMENLDMDDVADKADRAVQRAEERGLPRAVYGPGSVAMHLPEKKRRYYLERSIIGSKEMNKILRMGAFPGPESNDPKEVKRWARALYKDGASVEEWSTLRGAFEPEAAEVIEKVAKATNSYKAAIPDFITGQMVLDATGQTKGSRALGQLLRDAQQAQDNETFTDAKGAADWLQAKLKDFIF